MTLSCDLISGRDDLSVTVFVPSDCHNNCHFCTSKDSYCTKKPNIDAVIHSIKDFCKNDPLSVQVKSFVITGGEPLADLKILSQILKVIPKGYQIYINSTVPIDKYSEKKLAKYINNNRINALNISRHCANLDLDKKMFSDTIASDDFVAMINKPVKINSLTSVDDDFFKKIKRWQKFKNASLSFRADYRTVDKSNLRTLDCDIVNALANIKHTKYVGHGGCDVCFNVTFVRKGFYFSYHRGLENSSISFGNGKYRIINDIIIYQDGEISYDWK